MSPPVEAVVISELISGPVGLVASFWQAVREDISVPSKTEQKARIGVSEDQRLARGMGLPERGGHIKLTGVGQGRVKHAESSFQGSAERSGDGKGGERMPAEVVARPFWKKEAP